MSDSSSLSTNAHYCAVTITNSRGLHARAAAKFVKLAVNFDALVEVSRNTQIVSGVSIMGLMMLAASPGTKIKIAAEGTEAENAISALKALVEAGFNEGD